MKLSSLLVAAALTLGLSASAADINIVPLPAEVTSTGNGSVTIDRQTAWSFVNIPDAERAALTDYLAAALPAVGTDTKKSKTKIELKLNDKSNMPAEAYTLNVGKNRISIEAADASGLSTASRPCGSSPTTTAALSRRSA